MDDEDERGTFYRAKNFVISQKYGQGVAKKGW